MLPRGQTFSIDCSGLGQVFDGFAFDVDVFWHRLLASLLWRSSYGHIVFISPLFVPSRDFNTNKEQRSLS